MRTYIEIHAENSTPLTHAAPPCRAHVPRVAHRSLEWELSAFQGAKAQPFDSSQVPLELFSGPASHARAAARERLLRVLVHHGLLHVVGSSAGGQRGATEEGVRRVP